MAMDPILAAPLQLALTRPYYPLITVTERRVLTSAILALATRRSVSLFLLALPLFVVAVLILAPALRFPALGLPSLRAAARPAFVFPPSRSNSTTATSTATSTATRPTAASFLRSTTPLTATSRPLTTASMAPSALRSPPQPPPLFTGTPTSVVEDTKRLIELSRAIQDGVAKNVTAETASFDKVVLPLARDENTMALESHILGFYQSVSTDSKLRDASTEAERLMNDFGIESAMREDLYKLVDAAVKKKEKLDPESQKLLEKEHKDYLRNGLGLPAGPKRDRFKEIKKRLSDIAIEFQKNLNEENGGLWFTREQLAGVPEDVLSGLKKGEGENEGKLRLSFKYPDLFPTLKYAVEPETRKAVMIANENKCNQNIPLFKETLLLRDEAARLLGYPNHAAFRLEDKMAKNPETVDTFLGDLRSRLTDGGKQEIKTLMEMKKKDIEAQKKAFDGHYFLWDHRFYDRMMLEKDYSLDHQLIAEYFPLQTTIRGMLEIFEQIFGLVFVEIKGEERAKISSSGKGEDIVWHEDVQVFSVWNDEGEGSGFVGYLYLDLFPREGKYGHAANFNLQPGFIKEDGSRRYPATALVCNFSKPTEKKPSLLKHDEVPDARELVLDSLPTQVASKHYSTISPEYYKAWKEHAGDKPDPAAEIPDELIQNLIKTKHVNAALFNLRQLHFGIFDMTVHEPKDHEAIKDMNVSETYNKLRKEIASLDGPEVLGQGYSWGHGEATFGHLMGGYDAGYYGYLSSQVYSTDMFYTVFKDDPMNKKEGRRYRYSVLEKGGSQDEMTTLKEFLGREPKPDAFYKELGLA
ncbi:hypothetical protein TEQG_07263 [Trichophyton equinum CBS 127.97]|uniref:Peptidase M3A/M3B catalytic domain-containing protein n=1 Tax=Trichophyton equinum (strain ATCC MYA-4606 / CBS 127.97) TaxID=559882 RepID=F2Q237_TRIEC|nr:hypothetical protein TEQG_07263 [Trichophyton equinum CBS 127.97]